MKGIGDQHVESLACKSARLQQEPQVLAKDNRLSREEALRLFTTGAAWFENLENDKGRTAPGNLADFVLLSKDYFAAMPPGVFAPVYSNPSFVELKNF